jgi:hypothetical protein
MSAAHENFLAKILRGIGNGFRNGFFLLSSLISLLKHSLSFKSEETSHGQQNRKMYDLRSTD